MSELKPGVSSTSLHSALSRRRSLFAIAASSLAGLRAVPISARRGKQTSQKSKRKKKKPNPCPAQVEECLDMINLLCRDFADPAQCEAPMLPCCGHLAACDATAALDCFFNFATIAAP